jgi:hypothetical protein
MFTEAIAEYPGWLPTDHSANGAPTNHPGATPQLPFEKPEQGLKARAKIFS